MIKLKRGTESGLSNIVLENGQAGYCTDTHYLKIGDGFTSYQDLPYLNYLCGRSEKYTFTTRNQWLTKNQYLIDIGNGDIVGIGSLYFNDSLDTGSEGIAFIKDPEYVGRTTDWSTYTYNSDDWIYLRYHDGKLLLGGQLVPSYYGHIGEVLWSGSASAGDTIVVPNIGNYTAVMYNFTGAGAAAFSYVYSPNVYGIGGSIAQTQGRLVYLVGATRSGENLTIRNAICINFNSGTGVETQTTISRIVGLI